MCVHFYKCSTSKHEVGIISELMFYANIMHYLKEGWINYPDTAAKTMNFNHFRELYQIIKGGAIDKILKILTDNKFGIVYHIESYQL